MNYLPKQPTGVMLYDDSRDAWKDRIIGAPEPIYEDVDWNKYLDAEYQGWLPFCTAYGIIKKIEFYLRLRYPGINIDYSEWALAIMSNTQKFGNYVNTVMNVVKNPGLLLQKYYSNKDWTKYTWSDWDVLMSKLPDNVTSLAQMFDNFGYMRVNNDLQTIIAELQNGVLGVIIPLGDSFNTASDVIEPPTSAKFYHYTVLSGYKKGKGIMVHDSLSRGPWENRYYLSDDYPIQSVYDITFNMPEDWKILNQRPIINETNMSAIKEIEKNIEPVRIVFTPDRHGEAFIIKGQEKFYLGKPEDAFKIMKKMAHGVKIDLIDKIKDGKI